MAVRLVGVARPPLTWQPEAACLRLGNKGKNNPLEALLREGLEEEKSLRMVSLEEAIRRLAKRKGWRVS